jgi:serine phosphatase RsbU (regulator of sigma subunit)
MRIARDGSSTLVTSMDPAWIARNTSFDADAKLMRSFGVHSFVAVPMVAGGEIVGAITCALGDETTPRALTTSPYTVEDLFFFEELGRRAGSAIETSRLHAQQRRIAATLQAASLPQHLPSSERLAISAEYRPGSGEATIGGDWYDAFELSDGRLVITVGDVQGSGLEAAVAMTKLRQAMQSAAMVDASPNVMLTVADRTMRLHRSDSYATGLVAIYDPASQTTAFASAGHPGPLVREPGGTITLHSTPGLLLGLRDGSPSDVITIPTPPGSLLVFFTDGLTEATHNVMEGERRLIDAVATIQDETNAAQAIVATVLRGDAAHDDIAVLTLQLN